MRVQKGKKLVSYKDLPPAPITFESTVGWNITGKWRTFKPILDKAKCTKCYLCWKFCPEPCIKIVNEFPEIDYDYCKGCGICANECPKDAITMIHEEVA